MDEIRVKVVRSSRRTVSLEINPHGGLMVRAPHGLDISVIDDILKRHRPWIRKKLAEARKRQELFQPRKFEEGEKFFWLGKEYPLKIAGRARPSLVFTGESFELSASFRASARQLFEAWFKEQARTYLTSRARTISQKTGFKYKKLRISSASTRWGSCSARGTISLVWRLMMAPPEIIDYLIVHELAHTEEKNHSPAFWQLVAEFVPDYKERRRWLRANGFRLNL
ncbi:MAG TPA: SprT family zinc-dependent metalloprotease [Candidatus Saccharicenans sp.]|jgi:predicted metal-dependent hydrolase|nr:M48 family metallopeptidase [Candidatus Saccharicenans sp.]HRD01589.1 SprT family zinc-dependent metalloprotease [Candidatus Saccharicenans sp.]